MITARSVLREAISEKLVPVLFARGFRGPLRIGPGALHEYKRAGSDGCTQVLSIQFEKRGLPRFIVNLHLEPVGGIENVMTRGGAIASARLQPRPGAATRSWFRSDRSWWQHLVVRRTNTLEQDAVQRCISLLPEVDAWFSARAASAHVVTWEVKYPGSPRVDD